jgi:hypothetical protein
MTANDFDRTVRALITSSTRRDVLRNPFASAVAGIASWGEDCCQAAQKAEEAEEATPASTLIHHRARDVFKRVGQLQGGVRQSSLRRVELWQL